MAKINPILITTALLLVTLAGCDVNDPIYNTDHPDKATIRINTGWNNIGEGIAKPTTYIVEAGSRTFSATSDAYTIPDLFDPGNYKLWFYNPADGLQVKEGIATVNKLNPAGRANQIYINPMPEWLFTGKLSENIVKDTDHEFALEMYQQIRRLTLILKPDGFATERIESITASLSGVAATWDIEAGQPGADAASVTMNFTRITEGENAGSWQATVRLLGIAGNEQKFSGTITYSSGNPSEASLESDLTSKLSGFNSDKTTPLVLGGNIEVPTEAGFTATITDWSIVNDDIQVN